MRGTAAEVAARFTAPPKGEIAVVIGPAAVAAEAGDDDARLREALGLLIGAGLGAGRAADVAAGLGIAPRNRAYRVALAVAEERRAAT